MSRKRDPLGLPPNWHLDLRLEAELPEDAIVGSRFLINALSGSAVLIMMLFIGWLSYKGFNLRHQISDWEQRIADNRGEIRDIQRMQNEYRTESAKIDGAFNLIGSPFLISGFISSLGRTIPEQMTIDTVEWSDNGIAVRGNLRESSERASRLLGNYVDLLRADPKIGPHFRAITLTGLERGTGDELLSFEITFHPRPSRP